MKSSSASLFALITAPLLALANPVAVPMPLAIATPTTVAIGTKLPMAPSMPTSPSVPPMSTNPHPYVRPAPPDFSKIPTYHDDMVAIKVVLDQYAKALNQQDVSQFDKMFAPNAKLWTPSFGSLNGVPAIKTAVTNLKPDKDCVYTRAFEIDTVWNYSATAAADTEISGMYTLGRNCTTTLSGLYNTYGYDTTFGDWLTIRNSPQGQRTWQFTSRTFGADYL